MPADLIEICKVLRDANIKYYSVSEPNREGVMMFIDDGDTEFVLRDSDSLSRAVIALARAGWLSPEIQNSFIQ
jgi:hypothetical protein